MACGNLVGLKANQLARLHRLGRRRVPVDMVITPDLAGICSELSQEIRRQIGLLINRRGNIETVVVGTDRQLVLPQLSRTRSGPRLLRGVRLVHTHLNNQPLTQDDFTDLALLRLDLMVAIGVGIDGRPADIHVAHILPPNPQGKVYETLNSKPFHGFRMDYGNFVQTLETEISRATATPQVRDDIPKAIFVSASNRRRVEQEEQLEESKTLAQSHGIHVLGTVMQRSKEINPKYLVGIGKLHDIIIHALQHGADMLIFDQNLTPTQVRSISDVTELKVLDRTQLILDVFARRAHTRTGKIQVELAQMKYILPRLSQSNTAFSRLGGGIGGRGPGETQLETDLRRVRDRIIYLEGELKTIGRHRQQQRKMRVRRQVPVISLVGYTNAGKSTMLNALTGSTVSVNNRPFETLDTVSRQLYLPNGREVVITDTVGFLRELPKDLFESFRSTLEELRQADILLHVVDISTHDPVGHMAAVEKVLAKLDLEGIPRVLVFNKCDQVGKEEVERLCHRNQACGVSAMQPATLESLCQTLATVLAQTPSSNGYSPFPRPHQSIDESGVITVS
ncbi:MAG: GTPase HflX [Nitrospirales bacterium]|nr:GTPase HflX [Nitrospirales bacterium]